MGLSWKFHRHDKREAWEEGRKEYIRAKKEKERLERERLERERQEQIEDDVVGQTAASIVVLYRLGLLPKGTKK